MFGPIHFVLVGTTHSGNVGAAARAQRTMGFDSLRLAAPECALDDAARANASHAAAVIDDATVFPDLASAVADCGLVAAVTARERRIGVPARSPRGVASELAAGAGAQPVAVVFGREHSGLTNDETVLCQRLVHIPADPAHPSLNLAAAVQLLAYELRLATAGEGTAETAEVEPAATGEHLEGLFEHFERMALESGYVDQAGLGSMSLRLRRLFQRAGPVAAEVNLLRGLLRAAEKSRSRG
jgi:TrmH family RNA methyltransferase